MRWTEKRPKDGDRRVRRVFLWFPTEGEGGQVRWLERATIEEVFLGGGDAICGEEWLFQRFVDEADVETRGEDGVG